MSEYQPDKWQSMIRLRLSMHDAHYAGNLVDGAKMLQLFGDVATELLIKLDGDEGLFRLYSSIDFLAPVFAGDYIEAYGRITEKGNTSRKMEFAAYKVISNAKIQGNETACDMLKEPILVCKAIGLCVTPKDKQRLKN